MPKTSFDICNKKQQQQQAALGALIRGYAQTKGKTSDEIGKIIGCSRPTVSNKMKNPGTFTLDELKALQVGLDLPAEDFKETVNNLLKG